VSKGEILKSVGIALMCAGIALVILGLWVL